MEKGLLGHDLEGIDYIIVLAVRRLVFRRLVRACVLLDAA